MERFLELYERFALEGLGVAMILVIILLAVGIHKLNKMKKQVDSVIGKVVSYVDAILEEDEPFGARDVLVEERPREARQENSREEAQSRLINAVLEEIFP